jgi:hypothetical protein
MLVNIGQAQNTRAIDCYVSDLNVRSTTPVNYQRTSTRRHVFIDRSSVAHTFAKREQEPTPHMIFLHRPTIHSSHLPPRTCEYQLGIAAATPQTFRTPARPSLRVTRLQLLMTSRRSAGNSGSGATVSYLWRISTTVPTVDGYVLRRHEAAYTGDVAAGCGQRCQVWPVQVDRWHHGVLRSALPSTLHIYRRQLDGGVGVRRRRPARRRLLGSGVPCHARVGTARRTAHRHWHLTADGLQRSVDRTLRWPYPLEVWCAAVRMCASWHVLVVFLSSQLTIASQPDQALRTKSSPCHDCVAPLAGARRASPCDGRRKYYDCADGSSDDHSMYISACEMGKDRG